MEEAFECIVCGYSRGKTENGRWFQPAIDDDTALFCQVCWEKEG